MIPRDRLPGDGPRSANAVPCFERVLRPDRQFAHGRAPARRSRRRARTCRTTRGRRRRAGRSLPPAHWTLPRCPSPPIADRTLGGARYAECHRFAHCRFGVGRSHRQRPHLVRQCQRSLDRMEVGGVGDGCSRPSIDRAIRANVDRRLPEIGSCLTGTFALKSTPSGHASTRPTWRSRARRGSDDQSGPCRNPRGRPCQRRTTGRSKLTDLRVRARGRRRLLRGIRCGRRSSRPPIPS
jgi:hypothetical protein